MTVKTISTSAIAIGASFVAIADDASAAQAKPADQFHWSSAIANNDTFFYNGRPYQLQRAGMIRNFVAQCQRLGQEARVRGFLDRRGRVEWSRAEALCGTSVGGLPVDYYTPGGEIKVFGPIHRKDKNSVLAHCQPESGSTQRVWSSCGEIVPNDGRSQVLVGDGNNAGRIMSTARTGSGIETVHPILYPEVVQRREEIFRQRVEAGYYQTASRDTYHNYTDYRDR